MSDERQAVADALEAICSDPDWVVRISADTFWDDRGVSAPGVVRVLRSVAANLRREA